MRCYSRSRSRSFPGITTSHSRSQHSGMKFPFPFPKIGNGIFIPVPVPKSWEFNLSFPFPFPKFGNGFSHSHSRSQMAKSHSRSPLTWGPSWLPSYPLATADALCHLVFAFRAYICIGWFNRIHLPGIDLQRLHLHRPHLYRFGERFWPSPFFRSKNSFSQPLHLGWIDSPCVHWLHSRTIKKKEKESWMKQLHGPADELCEDIRCRTWEVSFGLQW